jgi:hypothetical protein
MTRVLLVPAVVLTTGCTVVASATLPSTTKLTVTVLAR